MSSLNTKEIKEIELINLLYKTSHITTQSRTNNQLAS